MAYNLSAGSDTVYRRLYKQVYKRYGVLGEVNVQKSFICYLIFCQIPGNVEYNAKHMVYSGKQHLFLITYEFSGAAHEVVLYWENTDIQVANSKGSTVKGNIQNLCSTFLLEVECPYQPGPLFSNH